MRGHFCLILHAHLPFVRHPEHDDFFEEGWLYEAVIDCYLPLLDVLGRLASDEVPYRIALSLTPTLVSMLRDELLMQRCGRWLDRLVDLANREVKRTQNEPSVAPLARFYRERFETARANFRERHLGDLVGAFRRFQEDGRVEILASAATHAFLPVLATNPSAVRAQIAVGVAEYRSTFGCNPIGFWLPECGYYPGVENLLTREGVSYVVVDSHAITHAVPRPRYGVFAPLLTGAGVAAFGRDPASSLRVWSADHGFPGHADYREFHRDIGYDLSPEALRPFVLPTGARRPTGIKYQRVTGPGRAKETYRRDEAVAQARADAREFVAERAKQFMRLSELMGPRRPVLVAPFDAELFGHWWYEGPEFLEGFIREATSANFDLVTPSDHLQAEPVVQRASLPLSSWGEGGYSATWLDDSNQWIYPRLYSAIRKMEQLAADFPDERNPLRRRALKQAARELMLAESSDWAFILKAGTTAAYARRRVEEHLGNFETLHRAILRGQIVEQQLVELETRDNLFPDLDYRMNHPLSPWTKGGGG
jgi:1,4-alpha-glucan branching enzyme